MNQVVADLFVVPEGTELISRENIMETEVSEDSVETLSASQPNGSTSLAQSTVAKITSRPYSNRNLFDSSRTGQAPTLEEDESGFAMTELDLYLIATLVADSLNSPWL